MLWNFKFQSGYGDAFDMWNSHEHLCQLTCKGMTIHLNRHIDYIYKFYDSLSLLVKNDYVIFDRVYLFFGLTIQ